jgi:hypothetical protein
MCGYKVNIYDNLITKGFGSMPRKSCFNKNKLSHQRYFLIMKKLLVNVGI